MSLAAKRMVAWAFSAVGVLFMIALGMHIMPSHYALFGGIACFVLSGMVWAAPSGDGK